MMEGTDTPVAGDTYVLGHVPVLAVDGPALLGRVLQRVSSLCVPGDRENTVTTTHNRNRTSPA